jgi:hypothetical protein
MIDQIGTADKEQKILNETCMMKLRVRSKIISVQKTQKNDVELELASSLDVRIYF